MDIGPDACGLNWIRNFLIYSIEKSMTGCARVLGASGAVSTVIQCWSDADGHATRPAMSLYACPVCLRVRRQRFQLDGRSRRRVVASAGFHISRFRSVGGLRSAQ